MELIFDILSNFVFPVLIPLLCFLFARSSLQKRHTINPPDTQTGQIQELPTAFYASLNALYIFVPLCLISVAGLLLITWCIQQGFHRDYIYFKYDTAITIGVAFCVSLFLLIALLKIIATLIHQKLFKLEVIKLSNSCFECTSKLVGPTIKFQWADLFFIEPIMSYNSAESIVRFSIIGDDSNQEDEIIYEFNLRNVDVSIGDFTRAVEEYSGKNAQDYIIR